MQQLEVAGTIIQITEDEAALVVYCNEKWQGEKITLKLKTSASYRPGGTAQVISRPVNGVTVYAAIFPRIDLEGEAQLHNCRLQGGITIHGGSQENPRYREIYLHGLKMTSWEPNDYIESDISLTAGNVTEIDWTGKENYR